MRNVEISVTAAHIAKGQPRNSEACPIALALREVMPDVPILEVNPDHAAFYMIGMFDDEPVICQLPDEAQDFVWGFDDGDGPGPFTFTMQIPDEVAS